MLLQVRYTQSLQGVVEPAQRYFQPDLHYLFGHVDSDYRLGRLDVSLVFRLKDYNIDRRRYRLRNR